MPSKKILFSVLAGLLACHTLAVEPGTNSAAPSSLSAPEKNSVIADLNDLVSRINQKLQQGKNTEADLADNIKEFDALLAKHKDAKPEERANILLQKANLYLQVFNDPEKALAVFKQIKSDFPGLQVNGNIDELIGNLQHAVESKKIRDALAPGTVFPDFSVKDLNGKPLSVGQYKGKVVLVNFWGTWCPPCIAEMPDLLSAYNKYHSKGFEVIGISMDEDKDKLERYLKVKDIPWPQNYEGKRWDNTLAQKYGVDSTPTSYLLDRDGKIIARFTIPQELIEKLDPMVAKALENSKTGK